MDIETFIKAYSPCPDARQFLTTQASLKDAWENCDNLSWMTWALKKIGGFDRQLVAFACKVVRETPLHDGRRVWDLLEDQRSKDAIKTVERWLNGNATTQDLENAAYAADAAYAAARAAYAADAAAYAAYAAAYAAYAAADAAYAADAADAAYAAAYAAARAAARAAEINMLREIVPFSDIEMALSKRESV